jgi:hypothetical protein
MRRLNLFIALVVTLIAPAAGLLTAAPAVAYDVSTVYRDCETNGQLTGHYSRAELQSALSNIPSQMAEYSDCQAIIQRALLSASTPSGGHHGGSSTIVPASRGRGGGGSGKGSSGRARRSHSKLRGSKKASSRSGAEKPLTVGGSNIRPTAAATSSARSLPAALLVVLILLGLTAVTGGALAIRRRVLTRHGT